jgi:hypothetical protein
MAGTTNPNNPNALNNLNQGPEPAPETTEELAANHAKKEEHGHHDKHPHHHHHSPRVIHPASSGTSHLDPGAVSIKP